MKVPYTHPYFRIRRTWLLAIAVLVGLLTVGATGWLVWRSLEQRSQERQRTLARLKMFSQPYIAESRRDRRGVIFTEFVDSMLESPNAGRGWLTQSEILRLLGPPDVVIGPLHSQHWPRELANPDYQTFGYIFQVGLDYIETLTFDAEGRFVGHGKAPRNVAESELGITWPSQGSQQGIKRGTSIVFP